MVLILNMKTETHNDSFKWTSELRTEKVQQEFIPAENNLKQGL